MQEHSEILYNFWYVAAPSQAVKRGKMLTKRMLGQKILLARTQDGEVFALRDFCPHRGVPLSCGRFDGHEIECCYHGWRFDKAGACTAIPSLAPGDNVDISRIKAGHFPCRERDGVIWVYIPAPKTRAPETLPELPPFPGPAQTPFYWVDSVHFPCGIDHAVIGLMDPSHGPYVHKSWWWRTQRSMHLKQKHFEPTEMGFCMANHKPSSNSRAYRILVGGEVSTEIAVRLPGLRYEHITVGERHHILLLTALTPMDEHNTELHQFMFTTLPALNLLRPLLKPFGKAFIRQDLDIVKKQQEGLSGEHQTLMLLGDADAQALWYFKLKKAWRAAEEQGISFENPLKAKTLHWRS